MTIYSHCIRNFDNPSYVSQRVISDILEESKGWQIWATLSSDLTSLAEAAPETLMDAIERDLDADLSPFIELFNQESDSLLGGEHPHIGLLWALERLAWSKDHFSRVAKILARLTEIDPGGHIANRPAASLQRLFLSWIRLSEAPDEHRLQTIRMLINAFANGTNPLYPVWRSLIKAYSATTATSYNQPPLWRPWAQDSAQTIQGAQFFQDQFSRILLDSIGTDADMWTDLMDIVPKFNPEMRQQAIGLLSESVESLKQQAACNNLWDRLRKQLHYHYRASSLDYDWAMDIKDLDALYGIYDSLKPSDPILANAWLFGNWPLWPDGKTLLDSTDTDSTDTDQLIYDERRSAIEAVYENDGISAVLNMAEVVEQPHLIGAFIVDFMDRDSVFEIVLEHSGTIESQLGYMTRGAFTKLVSRYGQEIFEQAISRARKRDSMPQVLANIYLTAPASQEVWQQLEQENEEVQTAYWQNLTIHSVFYESNSSTDIAFAFQKLLDVRRSPEIIGRLGYSNCERVPDEVLIQVLEAFPADVAICRKDDSKLSVDDYSISHLFEKLDQSESICSETIAGLEIPYIQILGSHRTNLALHREVIRSPSLFADLITWTSGIPNVLGEFGEQAGEPINELPQRNRAEFAWHVLCKLRGIPGTTDDGVVETEKLFSWVDEARHLLRERGCETIGDECIGQLLANAPSDIDKIWPCEPVRDLLDHIRSFHIDNGFVIGKRNLRGITTRGAFDGGDQERFLAHNYRENATKIAATWPYTAKLLRKIADSYEFEAGEHDNRAEQFDYGL